MLYHWATGTANLFELARERGMKVACVNLRLRVSLQAMRLSSKTAIYPLNAEKYNITSQPIEAIYTPVKKQVTDIKCCWMFCLHFIRTTSYLLNSKMLNLFKENLSKRCHIIVCLMLCYIFTVYNGRACHLIFLACCLWLHFNPKGEIQIKPQKGKSKQNKNLFWTISLSSADWC